MMFILLSLLRNTNPSKSQASDEATLSKGGTHAASRSFWMTTERALTAVLMGIDAMMTPIPTKADHPRSCRTNRKQGQHTLLRASTIKIGTHRVQERNANDQLGGRSVEHEEVRGLVADPVRVARHEVDDLTHSGRPLRVSHSRLVDPNERLLIDGAGEGTLDADRGASRKPEVLKVGLCFADGGEEGEQGVCVGFGDGFGRRVSQSVNDFLNEIRRAGQRKGCVRQNRGCLRKKSEWRPYE